MGAIKKDILLGFLIGIFATASGAFMYLEYFSNYGFSETLRLIKEGSLYGKVLSIAAIPNIFVFFIFLKKNQDSRAKGVLMAVIFVALVTLGLKFL